MKKRLKEYHCRKRASSRAAGIKNRRKGCYLFASENAWQQNLYYKHVVQFCRRGDQEIAYTIHRIIVHQRNVIACTGDVTAENQTGSIGRTSSPDLLSLNDCHGK